MTWHDLAFLHWPFAPEHIRPLLPDSLELDSFEGKAWLGVVPFFMTGVGYPLFRHQPFGSRFLELNVRTYVKQGGCSGIWFFSLDAASRLAVAFCRRFFYLPYFLARMELKKRTDGGYDYKSLRLPDGAEFSASYAPLGAPYRASPGELDDWLTARYCLFSQGAANRLYRCDIRHPPWELQRGRAEVKKNSLLDPLGLELPPVEPLVHFSKRLEVRATHLIKASPQS